MTPGAVSPMNMHMRMGAMKRVPGGPSLMMTVSSMTTLASAGLLTAAAMAGPSTMSATMAM